MARASNRTFRITVFGGMAVLMLAGVLLSFWPFIAASRQLQAFCSAQLAGTPKAQVQTQAQARGYVAADTAPGLLLVDDPRGFGRRQCRLALDAQGRVAAP